VLDDLESGVHAGGFGKGFHEGIVSPRSVDYPEKPPVLNSLPVIYLHSIVMPLHIGEAACLVGLWNIVTLPAL